MLTTAFRFLAQVRQARAFHPRGILLRGELTGTAPFPASATVAVRLSKGAGTGPGWPDVFGVAFRVPTESGDWDVLLSTTGTGRLSRLLPTPVRGWRGARLGTLAPYRYRGELMWLMAVPDGAPPTRFTVHASGTDADWRQIADVTLHPEDGAAAPIAFDPVLHRPPGMELAPRWLAVLREQAYEGSRRGRRDS